MKIEVSRDTPELVTVCIVKQQNEHAAQNNSADLLAGTDVVAAFIWHGMGNSYPQQAVRSGKNSSCSSKAEG